MSAIVISNAVKFSALNSVKSLKKQGGDIEKKLSTGDLALSNTTDGYLQATAARLNAQLDSYSYDIQLLQKQKDAAREETLGFESGVELMDRAINLAQAAKETNDTTERQNYSDQAMELFKQAHIISGEDSFLSFTGDPYYSGISINDGRTDQFLVNENFTPFSGDFTYEFSFSSTQDPSAGTTPVFFSYTVAGGNNAALEVYSAFTRMNLEGTAGNDITVADNTQYFDGTRHQMSITYESASGEFNLYMDGGLIGNIAGGAGHAGGAVTPNGDFVIGQEFDAPYAAGGGFNPAQIYSGEIYDVRFYNDVRSAGEIVANVNQTLSEAEQNDANLFSYWDLIGEGTTISPSSGAGDLSTPNGFAPLNGGFYQEFISFGETSGINAGNEGFRGWGTEALIEEDISLFEQTKLKMQQEADSYALEADLLEMEIDQLSNNQSLLQQNSENIRAVDDEAESVKLNLNAMRQQIAMSSISSIVQSYNNGLLALF